MLNKYYAPVILERFTSRENESRNRNRHANKRSARCNRQAVIPLDGPAKQMSVGGRLIPGDIAVFDDKAANAVLLEAESQLKSGYPTIAASSMVSRRNRDALEDVDNSMDVRFFSELVKPMQYRWKFQKEKLKTLSPSKHGFHQRSQSPTFQRLVEAKEKLHTFAKHYPEVVDTSDKHDFYETHSAMNVNPPSSILRYVMSEPISNRTSYTRSIPATNDTPLQNGYELRPEIRNIKSSKKEKEYIVFEDDIEAYDSPSITPTRTPPPPPPPPPKPPKKHQQEFKVDFKKLDSHSELHLFLPRIQESNSRGASPEERHRRGKLKVTLPSIDDLVVRTIDDDKAKLKKKHKNEHKKKKKHLLRIKSGNNDKEVTDRLNDIPTLISLENDKDYHPESMCMFENCPMHQHRKSNKLRQA